MGVDWVWVGCGSGRWHGEGAKLAGAEEEAAGKSGGDPSPPESAEAELWSDSVTRQWSAESKVESDGVSWGRRKWLAVGVSALEGMLTWAWAWAVE